MANNTTMVKFQKGLKSAYEQAYITDETMTFYYLTDTRELYLGNIKISNKADLDAAIERIAQNESDIQALYTGVEQMFTSMGEQLYAAETEEQSIRYIVANEYTNAIEADIGDMDSVSTTNKTVAGAINELKAAIGTGGTAAVVTLTESTTDTDYAKVYTLKQGETTIGNINIPKDMVVKTGAVEVNPEGQAEGTYIVLTLANATEDKIYVNVGTLVDIYKAAGNANQVQVAIDSTTREISATIVAGSITDVELANNAVITDKIADANVTKAKLSTTVQASLDKADTAMQQSNLDALKTTLQGEIATAKQEAIDTAADDAQDKADDALVVAKNYADEILVTAKSYADTKAGEGLKASDFTTGETNGTFKVKDTEVAIAGLGSAAYTNADAYDASGMAAAAEANAKAYADGLAVNYATAAQGIKADTALQVDDISGGSSNGTIAILTDKENPDLAQSWMDVQVTGLKSAAYVETTAFDAAGSAATAQSNAEDYTDTEISKLRTEINTSVDEALTWGEIELNLA